MNDSQEYFDRTTWDALVQIDDEIAAAADELRGFGERYVDDLAESYLAIGEKRYLAIIVAKIKLRAEETVQRAADDVRQRSARRDPEFDTAAWKKLIAEDSEVAAAMALVGKHGSYYAADLAASYQAIDDKRYLEQIVTAILAQARAEDERPTGASTARTKASESSFAAGSYGDPVEPGAPVDRRSASSGQHETVNSSEFPRGNLGGSAIPIQQAGSLAPIAFGALGLLFFVVFAVILNEYFILRGAHGDADRLEAYQSHCWICAFRTEASAEASSLRLFAEADKTRRHEADVAAEAKSFREAQGDIDKLRAYSSQCVICAFAGSANDQAAQLQQQADLAARQARIAELQRQQQMPATTPQNSGPPRQVTWRMTNSTGLTIAMQFFSTTRPGHAWPGGNMNWPVNSGQTMDFPLGCETGETICYGASVPYRPEYWGVGGAGNQACVNCCTTCDGALHPFNLIAVGGESQE